MAARRSRATPPARRWVAAYLSHAYALRGGRERGALERLTGEGVARVLAALAEQARLTVPVRPHGLRHTAITALLDAGAGLREAQRFSRHADPRTLMRYDDNRADIAGEMARRVSDLV